MARLTSTTIYGSANVTGNTIITGNTFISSGAGLVVGSGNTGVTSIVRTNSGSNYTSAPTLTFSPPTTFGGVTATANALMSVSSSPITIVNAGSGYTTGNILTFVGGVGTAATVTVTANGTGGITGATLTTSGQYSTVPTGPISVTGGSGSSATFTVVYNLNAVLSTGLLNPGSGYVNQPTITFTGGGGTGGAAYAVIGSAGGATANIRSTSSALSFFTPGGEALRIIDRTVVTNRYVQIGGASSGVNAPFIGTGGGTEIFDIFSENNSIAFSTGGGARITQQFNILHSASAVNFLEVTGNTTGGGAIIQSVGSDTNIGINIRPKGAGSANVTSTANSTSNTSGALVITGGMGITGNLFMSAANNYSLTTTLQDSYRLGWSDNYFTRSPVYTGLYFTGNFLAIRTGPFYIEPTVSFVARGVITNDTGNNTVIFNTVAPVRLQNTAASTSNTTGSLIVGGGVGVSGNVVSNSYITSTDTTNYLVRIDGFSASGPKIEFGSPSGPNSFMAIGAYNGLNNFETGSRNFRLGSTTVPNIMQANAATGQITFANNVIISGNLTVVGNVSSENVQSLSVADPLIKLGIGNYTSDLRDIGFAAHYNDGTNAHTGLIRDSGTKEYYLFQGYTPELDSNNNVIITDASFRTANLNANFVKGNLIATTARVGGIELSSYSQAAYAQANVTIGVDTTQNTRLTVSEGVDLSQNVRLDYSNTAITIAQGVDNSQNVRLDFSNTRMTIIEGTDTSQNARMVIIEGTNASQNVRIDYSNTAITIAQGVDNSQNVRIDFSNAAITIIQGVDTTQNTNIAATDGKMSSAYNTANNAVANIGPVITTNSVATVIIANTTASTSNATGALIVSGGLGVSGNINSTEIISTNYQGGGLAVSQNAAMQISGANTKGGIGYFDFLWANNTYSTSNSLFFRVSPTANLEIINSTYTTKIFDLSQTGTLNVSNMFVTTGSGAIYADSIRYSANGSPWSFGGGGSIAITNDTTNSTTLFPLLSTANSGTLSTANTSNTKLFYVPSTGTLNATIFNSLSDVEYKENIIKITNAVNTINQIDGVSFSWKENGLKSYGVIAQDIEKILPELVSTAEGSKSVNYSGIIAFLINSVKELDARVKQLENK
jgi:hypothetical protein